MKYKHCIEQRHWYYLCLNIVQVSLIELKDKKILTNVSLIVDNKCIAYQSVKMIKTEKCDNFSP